MPTYVYEREDGERFESIQSIKAEPLVACPETGQKVKRIPSWQGMSIIKGWSPDKANRKKDRENMVKANPHTTTLPEYQNRIDENTAKARRIKQELRNGTFQSNQRSSKKETQR